MHRIVPLWAVALAACPFVHATAQQDSVRRAPSGRPTTACHGQRIDEILTYSEAPTVASLRRVPVLAAAARTLHITTRPELVRRFLLLEPGDQCDELRRTESERVLRAQPYIADADVYVIANDAGGVDLEVRTSDEASIIFGSAVRTGGGPTITALRLGKYFGVSPEVWLNLQVDYDLRIAKRTTWLKAEHRVRVHAD